MLHAPTRHARRWWARCLIAALLFVQVATSAYACPLMTQGGSMSTAASAAGMPCTDMMGDDGLTGLCIEHCKGGSQSMEPAATLAVPLPALLPLFTVDPLQVDSGGPVVWAAGERRRDRDPPLAHSLAHCCYRL